MWEKEGRRGRDERRGCGGCNAAAAVVRACQLASSCNVCNVPLAVRQGMRKGMRRMMPACSLVGGGGVEGAQLGAVKQRGGGG